jgi:hypothetical protein
MYIGPLTFTRSLFFRGYTFCHVGRVVSSNELASVCAITDTDQLTTPGSRRCHTLRISNVTEDLSLGRLASVTVDLVCARSWPSIEGGKSFQTLPKTTT